MRKKENIIYQKKQERQKGEEFLVSFEGNGPKYMYDIEYHKAVTSIWLDS